MNKAFKELLNRPEPPYVIPDRLVNQAAEEVLENIERGKREEREKRDRARHVVSNIIYAAIMATDGNKFEAMVASAYENLPEPRPLLLDEPSLYIDVGYKTSKCWNCGCQIGAAQWAQAGDVGQRWNMPNEAWPSVGMPHAPTLSSPQPTHNNKGEAQEMQSADNNSPQASQTSQVSQVSRGPGSHSEQCEHNNKSEAQEMQSANNNAPQASQTPQTSQVSQVPGSHTEQCAHNNKSEAQEMRLAYNNVSQVPGSHSEQCAHNNKSEAQEMLSAYNNAPQASQASRVSQVSQVPGSHAEQSEHNNKCEAQYIQSEQTATSTAQEMQSEQTATSTEQDMQPEPRSIKLNPNRKRDYKVTTKAEANTEIKASEGQHQSIINWHKVAREKQRIPEGDWTYWVIMAGRGFGKTRMGAESIKELVDSGKYKRIGIIGKTIQEVRNIMIEGCSGILSDHEYNEAEYHPTKGTIEWKNGTVGYILAGDNYNKLRGLQFDLIWIDEFAKFKHPELVWDQVLFTLRLGDDPRCIITTTPRPIQILKKLVEDKNVYVTNGTTFENEENLSKRFIENIKEEFEGTKFGAQELKGELIFNSDKSLWKTEDIQYREPPMEIMKKIVVSIDPAVSVGENSDETGIIVSGVANDDKIYIIDDLSGKHTSSQWAKIAAKAYRDYGASYIVAEVNNGGDLVQEMIKNVDPFIPFKSVRAIKGKRQRAEPVALMYGAGKILHKKRFKQLEDEMLSMTYDEEITKSPDRVDALVWGVKELSVKAQKPTKVSISVL